MADPRHPELDATPEDVAVTGGLPAAAEAAPQTRGRRSSAEGFIWAMLVVGIVLVLVALFADQDGTRAIGTAIAGLALIGVTVGVITGLVRPVAAALIGFAGGALLTAVALTTPEFGTTEGVLLLAGAVTFISAFASLASHRRIAGGRGDEEARAGVESV